MCCAFHAHFLSIVQRTFIVPKIRKQWHTHKTKIGLGRIAPTLLDKSQNGWKARNMWTRLARTPFQKLSSYSFLSNVTTFGNVFFALGFLGRGKMKKKKKKRKKETAHNSAFFLSETQKSHLLPWFLLFLQWITFWVSQRPFTMWSLMMQVWCSERTTTECPDSSELWRVLCPGLLRPLPSGGTTGR